LLGYHYPIKCDRANLELMNAHSLFPDKEILKKKIKNFLRGRTEYLEDFEARFGEIPEYIRESLPYREDHVYKITEDQRILDFE
jgi:phosphoenolpyruvate carboxykinase (ATP)